MFQWKFELSECRLGSMKSNGRQPIRGCFLKLPTGGGAKFWKIRLPPIPTTNPRSVHASTWPHQPASPTHISGRTKIHQLLTAERMMRNLFALSNAREACMKAAREITRLRIWSESANIIHVPAGRPANEKMKQNRVHLTPVYDPVCSVITPSASVAYTSDKLFQINTVLSFINPIKLSEYINDNLSRQNKVW